MSKESQRYDDAREEPLGGYALLATVFTTGAALFALVARRRGLQPPRRVPPWDVVLMGTATFKASRLLSKDRVTGFMRAPFTRRESDGSADEVMEQPRGTGTQRAVGDLVSCPFCTSTWVAGALACCYVSAPGATRVICAGLTAVVVADWLQYAWSWTEQTAQG
jgi:hypothetical protein